MERKDYNGLFGFTELEIDILGRRTVMKKLILSLMIAMLAACTIEVGKVKPERKELYDHNNNKEFCEKNPSKCVNGIPWM